MTWRPVDCHAHSQHSDGALTVNEVLERAVSLGVRPSVTDHISRDAPTRVTSPRAVAEYLDDLEQYDVLRGGEFCWHDTLWHEIPPETVRRFTHRVGSLHSIRLADHSFFRVFHRDLPDRLAPSAYMEAHVSSLESLAKEMPVDVFAHPTLVSPSLREIDPHDLWSESLEERLVRALYDAGIAFEISNRYRPHERLVRRAADAGVRLSLGSDGHSRQQVADIAFPLDLARSIGVRDEDLYDPMRHGSRTGAFDA
jgi:histidinol phosphatase-like PHP family hydrolase